MPADAPARPFTGVIPAVITPFTDDLAIDFDGFAANLEALHAAGIRAVVVAGTMGESDTMDRAERASLVRFTVERFGDRMAIAAGISAQTAALASAYASDAHEAGAEGLMCLPPITYAGSDEEIVAFYRTVAAATPLPFIVYNNPEGARSDMSPALIGRLAELETVVAVKECAGDVRRIAAIVELAGESLDVLVGGDDFALEGAAGGAAGWIPGVANVAPRESIALLQACADGNLDLAQRINRALLPLARLDMTPLLVQYYKLGLDLTGLNGGATRPPRGPLSEQQAAQVSSGIETLRGSCPPLPTEVEAA
jgi:4-hydroxy-tetrahydrodipicolinate synthase